MERKFVEFTSYSGMGLVSNQLNDYELTAKAEGYELVDWQIACCPNTTLGGMIVRLVAEYARKEPTQLPIIAQLLDSAPTPPVKFAGSADVKFYEQYELWLTGLRSAIGGILGGSI